LCFTKTNSVFGFQKVLKHYYLQGLHQVVVNADLYVNGDVYKGMTKIEKKAMEVAANASESIDLELLQEFQVKLIKI
jgi:TRAP-type mannitol/chloroaromatic compound transport system substrate-binding protein